MAQGLAVLDMYTRRLNMHNALAAVQAGEAGMPALNGILSASGVAILRNPDGTYRIFTGGKPTQHTAVPQDGIIGFIREVYDPELRTQRETAAATDRDLAKTRAEKEIETQANMALEQYKRQHPEKKFELKYSTDGKVILYSTTNPREVYDLTAALKPSATGPMGITGSPSARAIILPPQASR
jgi:hypothetical protein